MRFYFKTCIFFCNNIRILYRHGRYKFIKKKIWENNGILNVSDSSNKTDNITLVTYLNQENLQFCSVPTITQNQMLVCKA